MDPVRFGLSVRARRRDRGWRQSDLAAAAGTSASTICRIERAEIATIPYGTLEAVCRALGVRLELGARWHGEGLDRLLDDDHARVVAVSGDPYPDGGWLSDVEVTFAIGREMGSIDRFSFHPELRLLAVNECKSVVPDAGNTVLTLDRKARLAALIARDRGWTGAVGVARFLILPEGRTNRRRIEQHEGLFRSAFPVMGREALAWIRHPTSTPISGLFYLPIPGLGSGRDRVDPNRRIPTQGKQVEACRRRTSQAEREPGRAAPRVSSHLHPVGACRGILDLLAPGGDSTKRGAPPAEIVEFPLRASKSTGMPCQGARLSVVPPRTAPVGRHSCTAWAPAEESSTCLHRAAIRRNGGGTLRAGTGQGRPETRTAASAGARSRAIQRVSTCARCWASSLIVIVCLSMRGD